MNIKENVNKIYTLLSDSEFKNPDTGGLFFPIYIYTYSPEKEFEIRKEIEKLNKDLQRPSSYINSLKINLYKEFVQWLETEKGFDENSLLQEVLHIEKEGDATSISHFIIDEANNDEGFIKYLGEKMKKYFEKQEHNRVYILLHGIGEIFPYLRLSDFLKKIEKYVKNYKLIAFYPGEFIDNKFSLFSVINDENIYRANHLNLMIK